MSPNYEVGSIVWVKLGQKWWPGRVSSLDECPVQYVGNLKKNPLAIVRFFNESEYHDVSKPEHIFPYSCTRKNDIIRKGLNSMKYDLALGQKFEADVAMAEKLTGGNMEIVKELKEMTRAKIDYSDLGFGTRKPKKPSKDQCMQRKGFSDIGEAIQYKRGSSPLSSTVIEHKTKIMEQPKLKVEEMKEATNWFKCYICGFTCGRLNVIIWHNKVHLKKVEDYDSGIRLPGRRKRRRKTQRNKMKKILKSEEVDHSQTNGHASPKRDPSREASQLLLDWEDEDDDDQGDNEQEMKVDNSIDEEIPVNGVDNNDENDGDTSDDFDNDSDDDDDYDNEYPTHKGQRQPMPKQVDINSAFDALLAESSPLHKNNQNSSYINNDSDSECSDWEKYYAKSDEEKEEEEEEGDNESDSKSGVEENQQNGHHHSSQSSKAYSSKRSNPLSSTESSNGMVSQEEKQSSSNSSATSKSESKKGLSSSDYIKKGKFKTKSRSRSPQPRKSSKGPSAKEADSPASPGPSISKSSSPLPERTREEQSEEHSTHSSSSSTSSGPAYMLVAVDAHGNNVPMPVLSEGGNHLVAVEASMEDGTTRTLYIDPAHLGPNVDLNNLMLHIDNSGQETVIIPTSTSDGEIISSTLVEQPAQDSSTKPEEEKEEDTPGDGKDISALEKITEEGLSKEGKEEHTHKKILFKGSKVDNFPIDNEDLGLSEEGMDDSAPVDSSDEGVSKDGMIDSAPIGSAHKGLSNECMDDDASIVSVDEGLSNDGVNDPPIGDSEDDLSKDGNSKLIFKQRIVENNGDNMIKTPDDSSTKNSEDYNVKGVHREEKCDLQEGSVNINFNILKRQNEALENNPERTLIEEPSEEDDFENLDEGKVENPETHEIESLSGDGEVIHERDGTEVESSI